MQRRQDDLVVGLFVRRAFREVLLRAAEAEAQQDDTEVEEGEEDMAASVEDEAAFAEGP